MARLIFPDASSRWAVDSTGRPVAARTFTVYADAAGTVAANIAADSNGTVGAVIADSKVTTDSHGFFPMWWGPTDGTDRLYVSDGTLPPWPVDADYNARIDALAAIGAGAVTSVAGRTGAVVLTAADVDGVETPVGAQAKATAAQAAAIAACEPVGTVATHSADTTGVHGIADTSALETQAGATAKANAAQAAAIAASDPAGTAASLLGTHITDTTAVHGITDTSLLETASGAQAKVDTLAAQTIPLSQKGAALGVATLGADGKLTGAQLPAISLVDYLGPAANQAAMLALAGQPGDWTTRDDLGTTWVITGPDPTQLTDWTELSYPTAPVTSVAGRTGAVVVTKADVGLANADNTSDADKPISTAAQSALDLKAPIANPTFTGTVAGVSKSMVGLGNVDNTSDANKPISTTQQAAFDLKAPLASPTFTGTVSGITKSMVGLSNVDNTADSAKPVSTAQATADSVVASAAAAALAAHDADTTNVHGIADTAQLVRKAANIQYVNDYIPNGTDTTAVNCSPYIQSAVTAAGVGGTIIINGRLRCDTEITLLNYQQVWGTGVWMGTGSPITTNCLDFRNVTANAAKSNQKVGFRVAQGNIFRHLLISGPGPTVASSRGVSTDDGVASSPRFYNVEFYSWEHGAHIYGGYYTRFYDCDFQYNFRGLYADACYNLNLYGCKFTCRDSTSSNFYTGIYINALARGMKMFGGSIEDYSTGVRLADHSDVLLDGVYFESPNYIHAVGIQGNSLSGPALTVISCSVYLQNHDAWVNMPTGTKNSLVGRGNKFIYSQWSPDNSVLAPTVPIAYNIGLSIGDVDLSGDSWETVFFHATNQSSGYTNNAWTSITTQPANYSVRFPLNDPNASRHLNTYEGRNIVQPSSKTITTGGLKVAEQANGKQGAVTLVAGTATVSNTSVTATSRIFLAIQSLGTVTSPKALAVTARTPGTSFVITSADPTDTSTVAYEMFEVG